jgi:inhibitor of KinA sporulation pathway (predicted exonuclease)
MLIISQNAAIIEAVAAALSAIVAVLLFTVARRQTAIAQTQATAQRLEAFREIVRQHHDPRVRELHRVVRVDLVNWFEKHKPPDMESVDWINIKSAYEDVMNYYEYLGSLFARSFN